MGDTVKSSAKTWCAARVQFAPPPPLLFFPRVHLTNFCTSHDSGQPAWAAPPRPTARTRIALTTPRAVALAISRVACLGGRGNPVSHYPPLGSLSPQPAPHARGGGACFGQRDYETGWWGEGGGGGFTGKSREKWGFGRVVCGRFASGNFRLSPLGRCRIGGWIGPPWLGRWPSFTHTHTRLDVAG